MLEVVPSASAPASAPAPPLGSPSTAGRELCVSYLRIFNTSNKAQITFVYILVSIDI